MVGYNRWAGQNCWKYSIFDERINNLMLEGAVKMSDRIIREMMGL